MNNFSRREKNGGIKGYIIEYYNGIAKRMWRDYYKEFKRRGEVQKFIILVYILERGNKISQLQEEGKGINEWKLEFANWNFASQNFINWKINK